MTRVFAGGNSSMCIDRKNLVYFWGNDFMRLWARGVVVRRSNDKEETSSVSFVNGRHVISYPKLVSVFEGIEMKDVAMGLNHMVVLDAKGDVYVGGDNSVGQLGLGEDAPALV